MNLTPTEQLHYEAIMKSSFIGEINVEVDILKAAKACAKITEMVTAELSQLRNILIGFTDSELETLGHFKAMHETICEENKILKKLSAYNTANHIIDKDAQEKITEQEKLKFAIEHLTHCYDAYAYQLDNENEVAFKKEIEQLQQQLNELGK